MRDLVDEAEAEESHSDSDEHENLYAGGEKSWDKEKGLKMMTKW